ncbi:alpha-glycosidase [Paenibacillus caui]|uniref:alpha-glycosidase n=1 Tax=Paenibacillus caui TaxID=2873927 RepID=UPI001CA90231|nr:alpha-glycosidase [Paenibacillus caui]
MQLEAVYHRPKQNWSFAYDRNTVYLRLRTKRNDVDRVKVLAADKCDFERTKTEIDMVKLASNELFDFWEAPVIPPYRRLQYAFQLQSGGVSTYMTERGFQAEAPSEPTGLFEFPYVNPADVFTPPEWVKDAIFYQIFPERFANGDPTIDPAETEPWGGKPTGGNFFGGDLQGVIDHLDHLEELGVTAIYFTPVFEAPTNHKYDTRDYKKVDPHFGTNETLKKLVQACHDRGIRVLLDAVFNHSGGTFEPFLDVKKNGARSRYADWFSVREFPLEVKEGIPTYETFAFVPSMPKLNTGNPEVKAYLLDVARYWIEEVGIDGWRLDVANEVDHAFWREFRKVVKQANPDAYILGEIWHDSIMWLQGDQFDAVMNYPFTNAVLDFFTKGKMDGAQFASAIGTLLTSYQRQVQEVAFNLLDSHDTPRLLTLCAGDKSRMKLSAMFQFTFPGTPCIYYGDEVGIAGGGDPDCRRCMEWDPSKQDRELLAFYRELIALRRLHPALRTGEFRFLHAEPGDMRIAYERKDDQARFVILMNANETARTLPLALQEGVWTDAFTGEDVLADGEVQSFKLPAFGYRVLKRTERPL